MEGKQDDENLKMYFFINKSLNMTSGCMLAQVSHVTQLLVETAMRARYEELEISEATLQYAKWSPNPLTIVKEASRTQLEVLSKMEGAHYFYDTIHSRGDQKHLTCVGFLPGHAEIASKHAEYPSQVTRNCRCK
jgi:hypothetical protein